MENIGLILIQVAAMLFGISVHEAAHAWVAERCGDPTGRNQGRITLNPIPHIDLIGSIIVPGFLILFSVITKTQPFVFGWAKPVMVNPYNLRNPRRDDNLISAAGPAANLLTAIVGLFLIFLLFKLTPVAGANQGIIFLVLTFFVVINVILALFNLIPIPPLDGSHILENLLRGEALRWYLQIKPYGFFIFLGVMYLGIFDMIASPVINFVLQLIRSFQ